MYVKKTLKVKKNSFHYSQTIVLRRPYYTDYPLCCTNLSVIKIRYDRERHTELAVLYLMGNLLKFFKFDNSDYEKKEMSKKDILCRIENLPSLIMIKSCIIGEDFYFAYFNL